MGPNDITSTWIFCPGRKEGVGKDDDDDDDDDDGVEDGDEELDTDSTSLSVWVSWLSSADVSWRLLRRAE